MNSLKVNTPIGDLVFSVDVESGDIHKSSIDTCNIVPFIPEGMSVEKSIAVLLRCVSSTPLKNIVFSCVWEDLAEKGYSASGEGLDAWEWEQNQILVMIGTEDNEWLNSRFRLAGCSEDNYQISMSENRITINVEEFPNKKELSLHFLISWNTLPEVVDCSCWYAVDVTHKRILESCN